MKHIRTFENFLNEAKGLNREEMMKWLRGYIDWVGFTEDYNGAKGGIWTASEFDIKKIKGNPIFDIGNLDSKNYESGIYKPFAKEMKKRGWYAEWDTPAFMLFWPI